MRWLLLAIVGCNKDDTDTGDAFCVGKPVLTYEDFGEAFMNEHCQPCHGSAVTGADRNDAPESVHFDDEQEVALQAAAILGMATGPSPFMPPEGGVPDEERQKLEIWLRCSPPEPE